MAYIAITSPEIAAGEPTAQPLFQKVRENLADHESRIAALAASMLNPQPITFTVKGSYFATVPITGAGYERVWTNLTLTAGWLWVPSAGNSGTLTVDVKYKRAAGPWTSIFSAKPSAAFGAGSLHLATNGVLATTALLTGDLLRLDVESAQIANNEFHVLLPFEVSS